MLNFKKIYIYFNDFQQPYMQHYFKELYSEKHEYR